MARYDCVVNKNALKKRVPCVVCIDYNVKLFSSILQDHSITKAFSLKGSAFSIYIVRYLIPVSHVF